MAQQSELVLQNEYFNESDGLVGRDVRSIAEDENGLIWIATNQGVNYFDGYKFNFIKIDYPVKDLILDKNGNIWVLPNRLFNNVVRNYILGSYWVESKYVSIINTDLKEQISLKEYLGEEVKSWENFSLTTAADFLVLQTDKQVYTYSKQLEKFDLDPNIDLGKMICIPVDIQSNRYYLIEGKKISFFDEFGRESWSRDYFVDKNSGRLKYFKLSEKGSLITQTFYYQKNKLYEINEIDVNGNITNVDKLNLTDNDILYFDSKFNAYDKFILNNGVNVTRAYGQIKVSHGEKKDIPIFQNQNIANYGVVVCMKDKYDNIWIGSYEGFHIFKIVENPFQIFLGEEAGFYSCRGIIEDVKGRLIVNTYNGIVLLENDLDRSLLDINTEYKNGIDIVKIEDTKYLLGSHVHSFSTVSIEEEPNPHLAIEGYSLEKKFRTEQILAQLEEDKYLVSSFLKLTILDISKNEFIDITCLESTDEIYSEYYYHADNQAEGIWLCGFKGLSLLNFRGTNDCDIETFFAEEEIRYMHKDAKGIIWLGTTNSGLLKWNRTQNIVEKFSVEQGLSNQTAHVIYPDKHNNLWITTNNGLNKFNKETEQIESFYKRDGLPNSEFNHTSHYKDEDGNFYFGSISGLVTFDPDDFEDTTNVSYPIRIGLVEIKSLNKKGLYENYIKEFKKEGKIDIYPDNSIYSLSFNLGNHFGTRDNFFETRLFGLEDNWTRSKNNEHRIGGLPAGKYEFQIRGSGAASELSENTIKIPIIVHNPIYLRPMFILLLLSAIALIVWLFFKWRLRRLRKEKLKLENLVEQRTQEIDSQRNELAEINRTKDRLFAIIAHDLRSPSLTLRGLTKKFNYLIQNERYDDLVNLGSYIEENLSGFEKLINNLLNWAVLQQKGLPINKEKLIVKELIDEILSIYKVMLETRSMKVKMNLNKDSMIFMDRNMASTILRNLIDNAIKYSNDNGIIEISSRTEDLFEVISIKDNGKGMTEEEVNSIKQNNPNTTFNKNSAKLGLQLSIQMIKLARGHLEVKSEIEVGSTFLLKLPREQIS